MSTWILVCDGSHARFFFMTRADSGEWVKFEEFDNPRSRMKGATRAPHDVELVRFAHIVAQTLDSARAQGAFERVVVVSPPEFLGLLRSSLSDATRAAIYATLDKDYTSLDEYELQHRISLP